MKLSIEKKSPDSAGRQQLLLTRHYGSVINDQGKRVKRRKRQSLDLFIYAKPKDKSQRDYNKDTLALAEKIRAQAIVDLARNEHHFEDAERQQQSFFDYMEQIIEEKRKTDSKSNVSIWESTLMHLRRYCGSMELSFKDMDAERLKGFRHYLLEEAKTKSDTLLSKNTASSYFNKVRATLSSAFHQGIIHRNPVNEVKSIQPKQNKRSYLVEDEIKAIYAAECRYDVLKRAFLFSCLTGMRWSDIQKLTWSEVHKSDDGYRVIFGHKKTQYNQYLDLPPDSIALMGERAGLNERVFKGLKYSSYSNVALAQWVMRAGITKHITFHSARHTFAVRMLTHGADIYTVSRLLGHSELKTTQVYADIIETKRKEAMMSLPRILQ